MKKEKRTVCRLFYFGRKIPKRGNILKNFENVKGDAETLAGFLLEISQGFPKKGETLLFHNYTFTIEGFENKRIKQIKFSIKN